MTEYASKFTQLSGYAPNVVADEQNASYSIPRRVEIEH